VLDTLRKSRAEVAVGHSRQDVVDTALAVLDRYGLADLTMRRLGAELGVRPSALYHHFPDKQTLLAAVADEILDRGPTPDPRGDWEPRARATCRALREAMLARTDGAELVATVHAYGLGAHEPGERLLAALTDGGLDPTLARTATRTLLHFVFGHTSEEQTHLQAAAAGAVPDDPGLLPDFDGGLDLVLAGIRVSAASVGRAG
jgi:TetR/AcrR family tetracycline transcriptional repressor